MSLPERNSPIARNDVGARRSMGYPISRPKVSSSSRTKETTKLVAQWSRHSRNTKVASLRCRIASWGARLLNFECGIR